jgi:hypothetical protein
MVTTSIKYFKNRIAILCRRFFVAELLVILLICSYCLGSFKSPSIYGISQLKKKWDSANGSVGDISPSFLKNNLVIDWDYYGYMSSNNKKKVMYANGPIFLSTTEKKPYYLFNLDIHYAGYPLKLFRNFTRGDGTIEFIDNHKEIKAVVFYKVDIDKLRKIKRKIKKLVWESDDSLNRRYIGFGRNENMGILFFND